MLELAQELNKHNKQMEEAVERQRVLIDKVDRIEEKLMEKELYNYEQIQEQVEKKKKLEKKKR